MHERIDQKSEKIDREEVGQDSEGEERTRQHGQTIRAGSIVNTMTIMHLGMEYMFLIKVE